MELKIKAVSPKIGREFPLPQYKTAGAAAGAAAFFPVRADATFPKTISTAYMFFVAGFTDDIIIFTDEHETAAVLHVGTDN